MSPFLMSAMGKFSQTCASRVLTVCTEIVLQHFQMFYLETNSNSQKITRTFFYFTLYPDSPINILLHLLHHPTCAHLCLCVCTCVNELNMDKVHTSGPFVLKHFSGHFLRIHYHTLPQCSFRKMNIVTMFNLSFLSQISPLTSKCPFLASLLLQDLVQGKELCFSSVFSLLQSGAFPQPCFVF